MKILFFLVHPAKFNFHKVQISTLKSKGHQVDVIITKKDILEDLVKEQGWEYTNIFPEGRKVKGVHVYIGALISMVKTILRLLNYTKGRHYDIFVGDLLTIVGRLKGIPSFYPTDDVLRQVPEQQLFLYTTKHIIAPLITDLGKFNRKTIRYDGIKALAHLHPNYFTPDLGKITESLRGKDFFMIRCVKFVSTHDINKSGINDQVLYKLVNRLRQSGDILISSERELPEDLKTFQININKNDIGHYLAFAKLLIADSTTMCSEAAVLGTPSIEYDNYFYEIEQMMQLKDKYKLITCIEPPNEVSLMQALEEHLNNSELTSVFSRRRDSFLKDKIDVSAFLVWIFENYPQSVNQYRRDPEIQYRFK
jgi:predicted glycosyltransferase